MTEMEDERQLRRVKRLIAAGGDTEYELDLRGLDLPHSLASINRMAERQRFRDEERSVYVRLDPAEVGKSETLFQPLGRHLLDLMRKGLVSHCRPTAEEGALGFVLNLPAGKSREKAE